MPKLEDIVLPQGPFPMVLVLTDYVAVGDSAKGVSTDHYLIESLDSLLDLSVAIVRQRELQGFFRQPLKGPEPYDEVPAELCEQLPRNLQLQLAQEKEYNIQLRQNIADERAAWRKLQCLISFDEGRIFAYQLLASHALMHNPYCGYKFVVYPLLKEHRG